MNNIREKLIRVSQLVEGGELEKDLALGLLREIYAELKFGEEPAQAEQTVFEVEDIEERVEEPESNFDPAPVEPEPVFTPRRPVKPEVIRSLYGETADHTRDEQKAPEQENHFPARDTLGDSLRVEGRDIASAAAAAATPLSASLRKSIGLNDRFVMIRDMFRGDTAGFDRTIDQLDRFATLDDAVIWLHDNFTLNPDSEGVTMLMNLLERRFS